MGTRVQDEEGVNEYTIYMNTNEAGENAAFSDHMALLLRIETAHPSVSLTRQRAGFRVQGSGSRDQGVWVSGKGRKVDIRLPGKGNSNSYGARPVY